MLIPKTRKEIYQVYLSGDTDLELPKPVTRDEIILYNACINGAGVPPAGGSAGAFVVTFTKGDDGAYTADKTFAELGEAVASGASVRGRTVVDMGTVKMEVYLCLDFYVSGMRSMFSATYATSGTSVQVTSITFSADNSVTETTVNLTST